MSEKVEFSDKVACDICGRFGAFDFGSERLCGDCYESRGSCCPEFCGEDGAVDSLPTEEKEQSGGKPADKTQ